MKHQRIRIATGRSVRTIPSLPPHRQPDKTV